MADIKRWYKNQKILLADLKTFQDKPDLVNPYKLLNGLAGMMATGAGFIFPHTAALKIIVVGLKLFSSFLKGYSEKRENANR